MAGMKELFQAADWKAEKHVPVIEAADKVKKGAWVGITVSIGKEIPHPNTTEHHIAWAAVYFLAAGEKFSYEIAKFEFNAHGSSVQGPNTSTIFTHAQGTCNFKTDKPGTIIAASYCNIHGLWENFKELSVE